MSGCPRHRVCFAPTVALMVVACAPSLDDLIAKHQWGEAICAVTRFGDDPPARDRVARELATDAVPVLHVHAVTDEELCRSFGPEGTRLNDAVLLLAVAVSTNQVPDVRFEASVWLRSGGEEIAAGSGYEALAATTGERLPGARSWSETHGYLERMLAAATSDRFGSGWIALGETMFLGTIPLTQMFGVAPQDRYGSTPPTEADYRVEAPIAFALAEAKVSVWQRPRDGREVSLVLRWRYLEPSYRGDCVIGDELVLALPPGDTLEQRINRLFGNRGRRVTELARDGRVR